MPELSAAPSINDSRTQALLELIARLADLAYHWFECASTGSADKAVEAVYIGTPHPFHEKMAMAAR